MVARRLGLPPSGWIKLTPTRTPTAPPRALAALQGYADYHRYPDAVSRDLRAAPGEYSGVDPATIVWATGPTS